MALKIRMARYGKNKNPFYRLVVADERARRDGRFIEQVGYYNPRKTGELLIKSDRVSYWLGQGAKASETVAELLKRPVVAAVAVASASK